MNFSLRSLPVRLSLWICSMLLIFLLIGMSIIGFLWFRGLSATLQANGRNVANETAFKLDRVFVQCEQVALMFSTMLENNPPNQQELLNLVREFLPAVHANCPDLDGISIAYRPEMLDAAETGKACIGFERCNAFICRPIDTDYSNRDWFTIPLTLRKPVWTIPYRSENGLDAMLLSYSMPFYKNINGKRTPAGVVVIDIRIKELEKYLSSLATGGLKRLSEHCEIFLMNQFGQIVLFPGNEEALSKTIFSICDEPASPNPADRKAAQRIFKSQTGSVRFQDAPLLGGPSQLFYARCENGWVVAIAIPMNWIKALLLPLLTKFLLGWALALGIIILVIFAICRRLNRPLVQLTQAAQSVGAGDFDAPLPAIRSSDEIGALTDAFHHMQTALADYIVKLKETVAARERSEGELRAAKAIQLGLLPHEQEILRRYPTLAGAAMLTPARGVGGDLYNLIPVDEQHLALVVGDVSGKGIPAALFMAVAQTLQRSIIRPGVSPEEVACEMNRLLGLHNDTMMFVTCWIGILNVETGHLRYANCGHNPPLLRHADGAAAYMEEAIDPPLAIFEASEFHGQARTLLPGDELFFYTDGVTESFNAAGDMFGEERLLGLVRGGTPHEPADWIAKIAEAVARHADGYEQSDDITLLAIRYR